MAKEEIKAAAKKTSKSIQVVFYKDGLVVKTNAAKTVDGGAYWAKKNLEENAYGADRSEVVTRSTGRLHRAFVLMNGVAVKTELASIPAGKKTVKVSTKSAGETAVVSFGAETNFFVRVGSKVVGMIVRCTVLNPKTQFKTQHMYYSLDGYDLDGPFIGTVNQVKKQVAEALEERYKK